MHMHSIHNLWLYSCMDKDWDLAGLADIGALRVFLAVIQRGSATKAAAALGISQPAVSKAIQRLERKSGGELFIRSQGAFLPNEICRALIPKALAVMDAAENLSESFLTRSKELEGTIIVGASTTISSTIMPGIIGAFRAKHSKAKIKLRVSNYHEVIERLLAYEIDIGFLAGSAQMTEIDFSPWAHDRLCMLASPTHPILKRSKLIANDFSRQAFVTREAGSGTRELLISTLAGKGIEPEIAYEFDANDAVRRGIQENLGLGCMSTLLVEDDLALGKLIVLDTPFFDLSRFFFVAPKKNRRMTKLLASFMETADAYRDSTLSPSLGIQS